MIFRDIHECKIDFICCLLLGARQEDWVLLPSLVSVVASLMLLLAAISLFLFLQRRRRLGMRRMRMDEICLVAATDDSKHSAVNKLYMEQLESANAYNHVTEF